VADPKGFMTVPREVPARRPVAERVKDWDEVYPGTPGLAVLPIVREQASRCMDCGIPFCHNACPLGNLIPEFNDLIWRDEWREATDRLHATNNFPEFTGRCCPAPCESACVVSVAREAVTIKNIEVAIVDKAWADRRIVPQVPDWHTLKTVAVVGSGPAGLAVAQQLSRAGHTVVVYERADAAGGLLRYGIPNFKLEKSVVDRRIRQMEFEGTTFKTGVDVGVDVTGDELMERFDAVVLAVGSTVPRDLDVPGRELAGIHQAMDYLTSATKALSWTVFGEDEIITAEGKDVVVIGGGDTGADCVGTALRQGARSVTSLEIMPRPPELRPAGQPWPTYPNVYRTASAHEEGGERLYSISTTGFKGKKGAVSGVKVVEVGADFQPIAGTERELPAQLVLLAMGFLGPEREGIVGQLGVALDERGNIVRGPDYQTSVPGVFACGDCGRGQSLIVWAIAEGRSCAAGVDAYMMDRASELPRPIPPTARPMVA
jgi:glutamate synthase (NADPH/NADH) small chain